VKIAFVALALSTLVACEKASDLGKMQEEATDVASHAKPEYKELDEQARALEALGSNLPHGDKNVEDAGGKLGEARGALNQMLATLSAAPIEIDKAAKSGVSDNMVAVIDKMRAIFDHDETVARADIESVQDWMILRGQLAAPLPR
jgi:hypothetical protein